jgi:hypothetical protein
MRRTKNALILAGAFAVFVCGAFAQSSAEIKSRNRLLESELAIAKASGSYMVIDIAGKAISLRARGMVLRKWGIGGSRSWGKRIPMKTLKLKTKSALRPPQRTNITPGKEDKPAPGSSSPAASANIDLGILELKDMPVHYDLVFDDDIRVSIKPHAQKFGTRITNLSKAVGWYIGLPIKTVFRAIRNKPFTEISIVLLSEKDAQEIYWAFLDGHQTIIIP